MLISDSVSVLMMPQPPLDISQNLPSKGQGNPSMLRASTAPELSMALWASYMAAA